MAPKLSIRIAATDSLKLYSRLLRYWQLLAVVHVVGFLLSELATWQQELVMQSGREDLPAIFAVFAGSAVLDIVLGTVWVIAVAKVVQAVLAGREVGGGLFVDFNAALIESVRSLARALRWLPVLIVPAIVKFVRLTFVPFIVVDNLAYKQGSVDALDESERLTKGKFWIVFFALILSAVLPSVPTLLFHAENISLASQPAMSITWSVFEFFTSLLATAFLFCLYRQLVSKTEA